MCVGTGDLRLENSVDDLRDIFDAGYHVVVAEFGQFGIEIPMIESIDHRRAHDALQ